MKQILLSLSVSFCTLLFSNVHAQIDIPIGTGTVGNGTTDYPAPLQDFYETSRAQYLYTAAELTAAGMSPGNILSIKFDVQTVATGIFPAIEQYAISIGTTATTSLSATTWESNITPVYGPVDYTVSPGINTFTFTTPFVWNGTDNIVIDICNGDPANGTYISYTGNSTVPWTTGLSFNGSHNYRADDAGNGCGTATTTNSGTQTTRPNIIFSWVAGQACSGVPVGGTATTTVSSLCSPTIPFTLSATGSTAASGLTYQWQSAPSASGPWTNITNATISSYTITGITANTYFRRQIFCGTFSNFSSSVLVSVTAPVYTTLPYNESFENTWVNVCDTRDVPNNFWRNNPTTGNNSWRRYDDAVAAAWVNPTFGAYTPTASVGVNSARFHTYQSASGSSGIFDLFVNANTTTVSKRLLFDYINTSGTDSLSILISTNGGTTFTRLDSAGVAAVWRTKTILFSSSSATTVIRFRATSDFSTTDIGIDNLRITDFAPCTGAPVAGTTTSSASPVCTGVSFLLDVTGATDAANLTYQWQSSPDNVTWTNIAGATQPTLNTTQVAATWYRRTITCTNAGGSSTNSAAILVGIITPQYTNLPYNESFENTWISNCGVREIPNLFWSNIPVTGNTSWRRNDDAVGGAWLNPTLGGYTPTASAGVSSARFHSYLSGAGSTGTFDVYLNCSTPNPVKRLMYDFINTTGNDSLTILISTNGGATFTRLDSARNATVWTTKTIVFTSTSATTVIRFRGASDNGTTDIGLDNIKIVDFGACSGVPVGGTATTSATPVCLGVSFTLDVTGSTDAANLTYQWQSSPDNITWTNIVGATSLTLTRTQTAATWYRRVVTCTNAGGGSSNSTSVLVGSIAPVYSAMPFIEDFESTWISSCDTREVPSIYWANNPLTGNNSWRRDDDAVAAAWVNPTLGAYTPSASSGSRSARFHTYQATSGTSGTLDFYVNCSTSATNRLSFDFINTTGLDSLTVLVSTNGGTSFTRLDSAGVAAAWRTKTIIFTSSSATTIVRFRATSDFGVTDIGVDNIKCSNFAPCVGTPVAGTTTTTATGVICLATPFTLNVSGATDASGLTYQWQSSPNNTTWTNIAGATSESLSITQNASTYYRRVITCANGGASTSSTGLQIVSPLAVSGIFTINSAGTTTLPNFQTFAAAYNYVKCGINGPVIFNVLNGTSGNYNEQLIMTAVPGASATNTVTFKGNGVAAIGFASANTNERAVIKLTGTRYIIFDSLVINANTGTYGYGVQMLNNADSNIVRNCIINSSLTDATQNFGGVIINGTATSITTTSATALNDYNIITDNTINGGFAGVAMVATTAGANGNNTIIRNKILNFYQYGIYVAGSYFATIEADSIARPTRTNSAEISGIYFTAVSTDAYVTKNKITNPFGGQATSAVGFNGINFNNCDATSSNPNIVSNNLVFNINGAGAITGLTNTSSDNVYYLHNTISLDNTTLTSTNTSRGFYQTTLAGGIFFFDNIITVSNGGTGTKHCIYLATNTTGIVSNFNDFINISGGGTNNFIGYFNTNYLSLSTWQTATGKDANSISRLPFYNSPATGDYAPTNGGVDNLGTFVDVITDIRYLPRNGATPDMGAYEFTAPNCVLPVLPGNTNFDDTTVCQNVPVRLNLTIGAWGTGQTFQWQSSTSATGPFTNMGAPRAYPDTTIISTVTLYYRCEVKCGGSTVTSNPIQLMVTPALPTGTYTINKTLPTNYPTTGFNFTSFNDAKVAMGCGITGGPVVFNVTAGTGPYIEQLRLDSIAGTSPVNTITFNGNGNTISNASTNTNERAVIKLSGADYIIFDSLRIDASTGTYGYGVQLINNADTNVFRKCQIISSTTATTTNFAGVVINATEAGPITTGNTWCDANIFDRDSIVGGYYGVTLVGIAAFPVLNNRFTNNIISDYYSTGFYITATTNTLLEGNTFIRPTRTAAANPVYGVYITTTLSNSLRISKNRFSRQFTGASTSAIPWYGVYHNNIDATAGSENIVSNNLFFDLDGNGSLNPLYNLSANNVRYYHNTISLDNIASTSTATTQGFYQTTTATGIEFKNNIISIRRGGTGTKHAMYFNTTASEIEARNNDYYVKAGGTNNFIGYYNTNQLTLANWQAASANDLNSLSIDPTYISPSTGDYRPGLLPLDNKGIPVGITADILNANRSATTPDLGAFEFAPPVCIAPPVAGAASVTPASGICLEAPIHLTLTGNSAIGTLTIQWQQAPSATGPWTNLSPVLYSPDYDTVTSVNTFYRAVVICSGNTVFSNVVSVTLNSIPMAGVYTINPAGTGARNFTNFQSAVAALQCGIADRVTLNVTPGTYTEQIRIPYVPGTSTAKTVTFQTDPVATGTAILTNAATTALNYTLRLDSASNFIIRNLTISGTNAAAGRVVELAGTSFNDTLINCAIIAPVTTSTANTTAGLYAAVFKGRNILVRGNTFTNGANAIYFTGTSATVLANPVVIDSNTTSGSYSHGIYTQFTNRMRMRGNTVNIGAPKAANAAGFYLDYMDTAFRFTGNIVNINNDSTGTYGVNILNSRSVFTDSSIIASNSVIANTGNNSALYGISLNASKGISMVNNVISLNSSAATANVYGIYHLTNTDFINYYNNSVSIRGVSSAGYAGYFNQAVKAAFNVRNNIFSNTGGGKVLFVSNPTNFTADYNMLYTMGAVFAQTTTGTITSFANYKAWASAWNWDRYSISYPPAFVSPTDLRPDIAAPASWAMHGRGTQIAGNIYDFNNNVRSDRLTAGVPDLGAYEFYPTALPTALLATPATPAPNVTQIFSYGTDTVMKITWGASAPASAIVRRYSGVVPTGLLPGTDSMYFYTQVTIPGGGNYPYAAQLYYINPWQGSIPSQNQIGMGRTTPSNAWVVGANSRVNVARKEITQDAIVYLDRFTGLINPFAQLESEDSSSNRGKDFWVGYQKSYDFTPGTTGTGGIQDMVVYMGSATQDAHVTISIQGTGTTPWVRNYTVPAGTAITSDLIPKIGADDARLTAEGQFVKKGIHIVSDVPIVAYAHIYASTNSGATMLMPTSVWGYEYYTLSSRQNYGASTSGPSSSAFFIVAKDDSTWVEINPTNPTLGGWVANGGTQPNGSYLVKLNRGDAYQVLGAILTGSEGYDLTGSYVKSIGNAQGSCHPIAVFAGSTRTGIGCGTNTGGSGDLIIQQIFPYQAWGSKFLTASTSNHTGPTATSQMNSIYRVLVKNPATIVKRNGVTLTTIINSRYYQFESNTADYIETNQPVLVAQYMSSNGSCDNSGNDGDPEMFYLSPVQQAIKSTQFYLNNLSSINENFITLVIPTEGLATLKIDGVGYGSIPAALKFDYPHPNLTGYTVVTKKWLPATSTASTVESDQPFTGIVYGEGSVESYGYNLGTLVKTLNNTSVVNNDLNSGATATGYTCKNAPFKLKVLLPVKPDSIFWQVSALSPHITPATNVMQRNPVAVDTTQINGVDYYGYVLTTSYTMDTAGTFFVPIQFYSNTFERCDKKQDGRAVIQVLPAPVTNFSVTFPNGGTTGCAGDALNFTGDLITQNGIALSQWQWTFNNGVTTTTPTGQVQGVTYPNAGVFNVNLRGITADGCISDTVKTVTINPRPVVAVVADSIGVCPGNTVTFTISSPATGASYRWYSAPTGGTLLFTGTIFTPTTTTLPVSYYAEATSAAGCISVVRKKVTAYQLPLLAASVATQTTSTATSVTFSWTPIAGAISYEVSVNAGAFTAPSGPGLTHTVTGLGTLTSTSFIVRANGANSCQSSLSASISACTNSSAQVVPDSISVCRDSIATFTVNPVEPGITYTWYNTPTGGTPLFTGPVYTVSNVTGTVSYYVQQTRTSSGCTSTSRKQVTAYLLPVLSATTVTQTASTATSVTFSWTAVPNAVSYSVSVNGGAFVAPSGPGLTHTVTGIATLTSTSIVVRANGVISCQSTRSTLISACTNSSAVVPADSLVVCRDSSVTFAVAPTETGITYTWYNTPTGGTPLFTGAVYTINSITGTAAYYVEQTRTSSGCTSTQRKRVVVNVLAQLLPTTATVDSTSVNSVRFRWTAVTGAGIYQVSVAGGPWITPSSGATGLTHTVIGLRPLDTVSIRVRAIGIITCQTSTSAASSGRTFPDQVYIPNTFSPNGDGMNDILQVYGYTVRTINFTVFNQWGQKIYESTQQNRAWDGTYKGQQQPIGVYVYVCRITLQDGTVQNRKGTVNLVR